MPKESAKDLLQTCHDEYLEFREMWDGVVRSLKEEQGPERGCLRPAVEEDGRRMSYHIADVELFCVFSYGGGRACIRFGFRSQSSDDAGDEYTAAAIIDDRGNVQGTGCNINEPNDYDKIIFENLLSAFDKAMASQVPKE